MPYMLYCKPRCNPEQETGQGVTVGVKAPQLPRNTAVDCFTQCLLIWSPYRVSPPRPAERLLPSLQRSGSSQPYAQGRRVPRHNDYTSQFFLFLNVRLCAAAQKEPNDKAMFLKIGSREKKWKR